jgi:hypothetical protein
MLKLIMEGENHGSHGTRVNDFPKNIENVYRKLERASPIHTIKKKLANR